MTPPIQTSGRAEAAHLLPSVTPHPGLPSSVRIHEVGPRDGLQNESAIVPEEVKAEFIRRLAAVGLTRSR